MNRWSNLRGHGSIVKKTMGYESTGTLAELVDRSKDAVSPAIRTMVDDGGRRTTELVQENTPVDTGTLRESMRQRRLAWVYVDGAWGWQSGTYTEIEYGPHVEHGTGLWGPEHRKYKIEPRKPGGVLAFFARAKTPEGTIRMSKDYNAIEGELVFARYVMHPGSPGQHMFAIGFSAAEAEFSEITRPGLEEWVARSEGNY